MIRKLNKTVCFAVMALALMLGFAFGHGAKAYAYEDTAKIVETGKVYDTFSGAYTEVEENQTIQLLRDLDFGQSQYNFAKTFTLDLNGHTISGEADPVIYLSDGTLTINDSGEGGMIYNEYNTSWRDAVDVGGPLSSVKPTLILKGGTLKSKKGQAIENSGTLTAEGGNIIGENYTALYNYNGTITIKDGTFIQGKPQAIDTSSGYEGKIYI